MKNNKIKIYEKALELFAKQYISDCGCCPSDCIENCSELWNNPITKEQICGSSENWKCWVKYMLNKAEKIAIR